jgi:diguanylate cyclase (GGDEF)-like protein
MQEIDGILKEERMSADHKTGDDTSATAQFRATLVMDDEPALQPSWTALWRRLLAFGGWAWSATAFDDPRLKQYAEDLMLYETRRGIMVMAILSFVTDLAAIVLHYKLGSHMSFFYTFGLLALLSLHIAISSRYVNEISSLHLLGTILLVIAGVAIMSIAHRTGTVNAALLASVVLLFMVMPIAPWGLREAFCIVGLTYVTFTLSSVSVAGRFDPETLWTLQFLMLASAAIATLTIMRNTLVRRDDIVARYELEAARAKLQLVSTRDPLTGAWNRRYLEQNFVAIARAARDDDKALHLAVLDVDLFKHLNDTFGHHHGDATLRRLVAVLTENLSGTAHVIRLGGDEFAVLDTADEFEAEIERCLRHLATDPRLLAVSGEPVRVSVGFAAVGPQETADLDRMYRIADEALYACKADR